MKVKTKPLAILARETLEKNIRNGTLSGQLPPERVLCEQLGISRPVLREALNSLQDDGRIAIEGRRRRICQKSHLKNSEPLTSVHMLCQNTEDMIENEIIQTQAFLAETLAAEHIEFHFHHSRGCFVKNADRFLEPLTRTNPNALWILYRSTPDMQAWFCDSKIPAIVLGSLYNGIRLPNIDTDYANICRHATGLLTGRGHRHAALIRNSTLLPGDQISMKSFESEWNSRPDRQLTTAEHDGSTESICKAVDRLLALSNRPTAWFIFGGRPYLTVS
jgi:DNA-binding transcriptional regulator YhcF (GntR family)